MGAREDKKSVADIVEIEYNHYMVHDGGMFSLSYADLTVTSTAVREIMIKTESKDTHFALGVNFGAQGRIQIYEDITYTSDTTSSYGTTLTAFNMDRNSSNTPLSTFYLAGSTPSWTTSTLIFDEMYGADTSKAQPVGGGARSNVEWDFKPNTKYLIRLLNISAGTASVSFVSNFYEKAD